MTGAVIAHNYITGCKLSIALGQDSRLVNGNYDITISNNSSSSYIVYGLFSSTAANNLVIADNSFDPGSSGGQDAIRLDPAPSPIANATAGAGNQIKITCQMPHLLQTGQLTEIVGVGGTTEANGTWTITYVDAYNILLQGSTFVHAYTSGGTCKGGYLALSVTGNVLGGSLGTTAIACPDALISNNRINNGGLYCPGLYSTISGNVLVNAIGGIIAQGTDARINGNCIRQSNTWGIVAGANALIESNKIIDANTGNSVQGAVYLDGNNCMVMGNHIENRTAIGLATHGINARSTGM